MKAKEFFEFIIVFETLNVNRHLSGLIFVDASVTKETRNSKVKVQFESEISTQKTSSVFFFYRKWNFFKLVFSF